MYKDCCWQVQYGSAGEETLSICTEAGWNPLWRHHCGWEYCHPHPGDALYTHLLYHSQSDPERVNDVCVCSGAGWVGHEDWSGVWAGCHETHSPLSAVQPLLGHSALHWEPQGAVSLKYIYIWLIMLTFTLHYICWVKSNTCFLVILGCWFQKLSLFCSSTSHFITVYDAFHSMFSFGNHL